MRVHVAGIGFAAPGLSDWDCACAVLAGRAQYLPAPLAHAVPEALPAAERRRAGPVIRLAIAVAQEAVARSGLEAAGLASVFASADGDGENVHHTCLALAGDAPEISPTRFHNSVQNAASGYWTIAMRAHAPTTTVNGLDGIFATGLLEATTQVVAEAREVLLVAYDLPLPQPLAALHPTAGGAAVALVLAPQRRAGTLATLDLALAEPSADTVMGSPELDALRTLTPPARALPLLATIARAARAGITLAVDSMNSLAVSIDAHRTP